MIKLKLLKWIKKQNKAQKLNVKKIKLSSLTNWKIDNQQIYHISKKFFKIIGVRIKSNFYEKSWDQPIILQNEIGILGIIKNINTNKYLLQAKAEPGNINKIQISPSVQATKSNYSRVHGGKSIPYLKYFLKKNKYFSLQSEQAFRYYKKYNSNIISFRSKNISLLPTFRWFSKKEILFLLKKKNLINMDTLSVFSSFIRKIKTENPLNNKKQINKWTKALNKKFYLKTKKINLGQLKHWKINDRDISHTKKSFFSIIGIKVKTNKREIKEWSQPIVQGSKMAFSGFIMKEFNKTDHYLCRYILKPGAKNNTFTCTANTSNISNYMKNSNIEKFQKKVMKEYFFNKKINKSYNNILSDEGGRFFHSQINYIACKLKNNQSIKVPSNYIWLSTNQIIDLIKKKRVDIEARLLFGIINFKGIL